KTVPLGMIFAFIVVTTFYVLVVFVTSGILNKTALNNSLTPISLGASIFWGTPGKIILSIAAILAFISTANAGIMASSRYPLALGRDKLMPKFLMKISNKFKTPYIALIITTIFIALSLFFKLKLLIKTASTVLILTFIFSCLCVIIMRESKLQNYRPKFKSPLYPWVQIIGIIGSMFLIFQMGTTALLICVILIIGSLLVYFFYGRIRADKEFALLHLIERITNKELTTRYLESELRDIIKERDEIVSDRFDELIEKSIVLDIKRSVKLEEFLELASRELSTKLDLSDSFIYEKLMERENEGSTVISRNLAIPHIIIEGTNKFVILLARCKEGIRFSDTSNCIKTVFVLMGTKDERNFHLRALSAIAQVVQDPIFEDRWESAKNIEDLKDTVLLVKRKRN
ncbi:MAG TPA: amino acid permease, partial [Victivallales bacterium]|nr:amino acid permease [Victivallales bacterium]